MYETDCARVGVCCEGAVPEIGEFCPNEGIAVITKTKAQLTPRLWNIAFNLAVAAFSPIFRLSLGICTGPPSAISCARFLASYLVLSRALALLQPGLSTAHRATESIRITARKALDVFIESPAAVLSTNSSNNILAIKWPESNDMGEWSKLVNALFK